MIRAYWGRNKNQVYAFNMTRPGLELTIYHTRG